MPAYVFINLVVTDDAAHAEYRERAPRVVEAYGGRLIARGDVVESTDGESTSRRRMMVMEFPTIEQARAWLDLRDGTPEQREVRALRDRMGNITSLNIVEGEDT